MRPFLTSLRLTLVLVAIFGIVSLGMAERQDTHKGLRCGSNTKLDMVLNHPKDYFGTTVTVEGEMHRTFNDKVFSIEDDDFLRDDDLLVIATAPKSEVVKAVKDSIAEGKDVCVTGVIQPFHRSDMESKFGPLNIESRASHYPEGSPVMIIEHKKPETAMTFDREKTLPEIPAVTEPEPLPSDLPTELEPASPEAESQPEMQDETKAENTELPATGSPFPLIGVSGVLSLLAAAGMRFRRR